MKQLLTFFNIILSVFLGAAQAQQTYCDQESATWEVGSDYNIIWNVAGEKRLPHHGTFEMGGASINAEVHYTVAADKSFQLSREFTFPDLMSKSIFSTTVTDEGQPKIAVDGHDLSKMSLAQVSIDGNITFLHQTDHGISIERKLFPDPSQRLFVEYWEIKNIGPVSRLLSFNQETHCVEPIAGKNKKYQVEVSSDVRPDITLEPNGMYRFALYYSMKLAGESPPIKDAEFASMKRTAFLQEVGGQALLVTPNPALNTAFELAKIRAAERFLIKKSIQGSINAISTTIQHYPDWVTRQAVPYTKALSILEGLKSDEPATARTDLLDYTCQHLLGANAPNLGTSSDIPNSPQDALYCRLFTEGFFGISKTEEHGVIRCQPRMPSTWKEMELQELKVYEGTVSLRLSKSRRYRGMYYFSVVRDGLVILRKKIQAGRSVKVYVGGTR